MALDDPNWDDSLSEHWVPLAPLFDTRLLIQHLRRDWRLLQRTDTILKECELLRVHPRPEGGIFHYVVRLERSGSETRRELFGEWVGTEAISRCRELRWKLAKKRRKQIPRDERAEESVFCLPELGVVMRQAGLDERLPGLRLIHDIPALRLHLASEGLAAEAQDVQVELLGHRPGKRCIVRIHLDRQASIIVKLYKQRSDKAGRVHALTASLWKEGFDEAAAIRIPRPLGHYEPWRMVVMEDVALPPLIEALERHDASPYASVGEALAKLHRHVAPPVAAPHTAAHEIALIRRNVTLTANAFPALAHPLARCLEQAVSALADDPGAPTVLAHRDFYEKQLFYDRGRVVLIDFDTTCFAEPAVDLGNFLAHLTLRRLQGMAIPETAETRFLQGYRVKDRHLMRRIDAYRRATLLRLACLYAFRPAWRRLIGPLLRFSQRE